MAKEIKIINTLSTYSTVHKISIYMTGEITVIGSPFANCQSFSIGNMQTLMRCDIDTIKVIFKEIKEITHKRQFICDIQKKRLVNFKNIAKQLGWTFNIKSYISTNQSNMILIIVKLPTK